MRDHLTQIRAAGAELTVIGSGNVQFAAAFKAERDLDFTLLADPGRVAFKAAALKRGALATFSPLAVGNALRALSKGERQGGMQGDALQQGGAFVILPDGSVPFAFVSQRTGHHADPADILAALEQPASS